MRFIVPRPERVDDFSLQRAYLAGSDCVPWLSRADWEDGQLVVEREIRESGCLFIPWPVPGWGELVLSTASLMERKQPYLLPLELARGTLNRCRNYAATWQMSGLQPSAGYTTKLRESLTLFTCAATGQHDPLVAGDDAEGSLRLALDAMQQLVDDFVRQANVVRRQNPTSHTTLLAGQLGATPLSADQGRDFLAAFNAAALSLSWRDIEAEEGKYQWDAYDRQILWCRENGLKVIGGPVLRLNSDSLPDWLYLYSGDYEMVQAQAMRFVEAAVKRYRGKLHVWNAISRMNVSDTLRLTEEERLRLTVDVIETVRRIDPRVPMIATFDQPWGEYLSREEMELSPLHFADTLVRSELGMAGVGLEINYGYWPDGTAARDSIEFARLLDQWSALGLPLVLMVTAPSSVEPDPLSRLPSQPGEAVFDGGPSPLRQCQFLERVAPFCLSLQAVQGIVWNQLLDGVAHPLPHGGLFDAQNAAKPALAALAAIRSQTIG